MLGDDIACCEEEEEILRTVVFCVYCEQESIKVY